MPQNQTTNQTGTSSRIPRYTANQISDKTKPGELKPVSETAEIVEPDEKSSSRMYSAKDSNSPKTEVSQTSKDQQTSFQPGAWAITRTYQSEILDENILEETTAENVSSEDDASLDNSVTESYSNHSNLARLFPSKSKPMKVPEKTVYLPHTMPKFYPKNPVASPTYPVEYFCNVDHHHNLEDELSSLRKKLYSLQCNDNPLEEYELRKQLEQKDAKIRQLESSVLSLSNSEAFSKNNGTNGCSFPMELFKARVMSLTAALGKCSVHGRVIESYLEGKSGIEDLRDLISRAENVQELASESHYLEQEITKSQSQLDNLQHLISQCEEKADILDNQIKTKLQQLADKEIKWDYYQKQGRDFSLKIEKALSDLDETNATLEMLRKECKSLLKEKTQLISEVSDFEKCAELKKKDLDDLQQKCGDACNLLKKAKNDEEELLKSLDECEEVLSRKESEIEDLTDQIQVLTSEYKVAKNTFLKQAKSLELVSQELDTAKAELTEVKAEVETLNDEKTELTENLETFVTSLEDRKEKSEQFLSTVDEKYRRLCEQAENEANKIKKLLNESEGAETRRNYLVELMKLEENQLEGLKAQHEERSSQLQNIQNQLNQERNELEKLQKERLKQEHQLCTSKKNLELVESQVMDVEKAKLTEVSSLNSLKRTRTELEVEINSTQHHIDDLKSVLKSKKEELEEIKKLKCGKVQEIKAMESKSQNLENQIQEANRSLSAAQADYVKCCDATKAMASELEERNGQLAALNQALKQLSQQVLQQEARLKEKIFECQRAETHLGSTSELKNQVDALTLQKSDAEGTIESLRKEVSAIDKKASDLNESLEAMENKNRQQKETISVLRNELSQSLQQSKFLEKELETSSQDKFNLKMQVAELESKLDAKKPMDCSFELHRTESLNASQNFSLISQETTPRCPQSKASTIEKKSISDIKQSLQKQLDEAENRFSSRKFNPLNSSNPKS